MLLIQIPMVLVFVISYFIYLISQGFRMKLLQEITKSKSVSECSSVVIK